MEDSCLTREGGLQGGIGTGGPGADPTGLTPVLGKQSVISGFLRHCLVHQTVSQTRVAVVS